MGHYKSNLRDIEFNLFEVLGRDQVLGTGPFADIDAETAREILGEVDRLAREDLAASFDEADRTPPVFDPETHTAPVPEAFKKSYQAWMDAEYWRLGHPGRARRHARALVVLLGRRRDGARRQPGDLDVRRRPDVRRRHPPQRQRAGQEDRPAHRRPRLADHHGAHRARRRLRRRRRPDQGHAQRRRHLAHRGRQALHHLGRGRPLREHHPLGAGPPVGSRAPAARAPRA